MWRTVQANGWRGSMIENAGAIVFPSRMKVRRPTNNHPKQGNKEMPSFWTKTCPLPLLGLQQKLDSGRISALGSFSVIGTDVSSQPIAWQRTHQRYHWR